MQSNKNMPKNQISHVKKNNICKTGKVMYLTSFHEILYFHYNMSSSHYKNI